MKPKILLLIIIALFTVLQTNKAQGIGVEAGYKYNKNSMGYLGAGIALASPQPYHGNSVSVNIGGGVNYGKFSGNSKFIPVGYASFGYLIFETKIEASKYYIAPSIGINAMNLAKIHLGRSFSTSNKLYDRQMQGFTFSLIFSIGTSGYHGDYSN